MKRTLLLLVVSLTLLGTGLLAKTFEEYKNDPNTPAWLLERIARVEAEKNERTNKAMPQRVGYALQSTNSLNSSRAQMGGAKIGLGIPFGR